MVTLKKGEAAECEFIITPNCSCCVDDEVMITVLNMSTGEETSTPLEIRFETVLTTILDPDELIEEKKLGEGSFGVVMLGDFRGHRVAIKKMKEVQDRPDQIQEFEKEVAMLDKFRCDYIIHFYGAVFIPGKICMVTEYAPFGSLADLIKTREEPLPENIRIKLMLDAARGIRYLHQNGI